MAEGKIHAAMAAVLAALTPIVKQQVSAGRGGSFKAFAIDDLYRTLHPLFADHEIFLLPEVLNVEYTAGEFASGGAYTDAHVKVAYHFMHADGSSVRAVFQADGRDGQDKATNKAVQQALKYALVQTFLIVTGDTDADAAPLAEPRNPDYTNAVKQAVLEMCEGDVETAKALFAAVVPEPDTPVHTKTTRDALILEAEKLLKTRQESLADKDGAPF